MRYDNPVDLPTFLGDYVIEDEVGRGGMKLVVRAHQNSTSKTVAVALLRSRFPSSELRERFFREAKAMQEFSHPNIVEVYEAGNIDGQPFFTMEYVSGEPLSAELTDHAMPPDDVLELLLQICDALDHVHQKGVFHRDLKPDNILLDPDNTPKLIDFGLAKDQTDDRSLTKLGQGLGTLIYVSPEQKQGDLSKISAATDIYALGVTMLEMLLGSELFLSSFQDQLPFDVLNRADAFPDCPAPSALLDVCRKCVNPNADDRYMNVSDLYDELTEIKHSGALTNSSLNAKQLTSICHRPQEPPSDHTHSPSLGVGTVIGKRYKLVSLLGRGGMGEVWKAEAFKRSVPVVVKFLPELLRNNPREMDRLQNTFQLVSRVHHSHICPLFDLDEDPVAGVFLVMMYVEGTDLAQQCQRKRAVNQSFSVTEVCRILHPIAQAIDEAHSKNVLHRDIKLANIMMSVDQKPMLVDFGLAEQIRSTVTPTQLRDGPSGTLEYLAPELWRGQDASRASDQYALGVVAYTMQAGRTPFDSSADTEVLRQCVLNERVPALNLANRVNEVLKRVLAKEPGDRFPDCASFVEALRCCNGQPSQLAREKKHRLVQFTAPVLILGVLAIVVALSFSPARSLFTKWSGALVAIADDSSSRPSQPTNESKIEPRGKAAATKNTLERAEDRRKESKDDRGSLPLEPPYKTDADPMTNEELAREAFEIGVRLFSDGDTRGAINKFDRAIQLDDEFSDAYAYRGQARLGLGDVADIQRAIADFDRAIELRSVFFEAQMDRARALMLLGLALQKTHRQEDTIELFQQSIEGYAVALRIKPGNPFALHGKGTAKHRLGLHELAIRDYSSALEADDQYADAYESRAAAYFHRGRYADAQNDYERAILFDPSKTHLAAHIKDCETMRKAAK